MPKAVQVFLLKEVNIYDLNPQYYDLFVKLTAVFWNRRNQIRKAVPVFMISRTQCGVENKGPSI